jgi:hypothetical protein
MSSTTSTATLASWDPIAVLSLMNPDKLAITCVGHAPSCRRRCRNAIAADKIQAAKAVMRDLVRPGVSDDEVKNLLFELAEYTLCRRYHQNQAAVVSDGWWRLVQAHREDEEERFSDTSDDGDGDSDDDDASSSSGSDGDSDDGSTGRRRRDNRHAPLPANEFIDSLQRLQREFDELLRRQRQQLLREGTSTVPAIQTQQPHTRETHQSDSNIRQRICEQEAQHEAEQLRREEAYLLAQREREEARERSRRATAEAERTRREEAQRQEAREEAQREAEAERLRQEAAAAAAEAERRREEEAAAAEKARQERERQHSERQQQTRARTWDDAWLRYEQAWSQISSTDKPSELDLRKSLIWPTKTGSYSSCSESDVKVFFLSQPGSVSRNVVRRQALRWHPDRAARLFGYVKDESQLKELMKAVTMISQVVIGIMAIASR